MPEGIAQRRAEDEEHEKQMEEEEREKRRARLGHMFTFARQHFWKLGDIPKELRKELVEFGLTHPPRFTNHFIEPSAFEEVYFKDVEVAHSWQEEWSDEHEDDDLLVLLRFLRKINI